MTSMLKVVASRLAVSHGRMSCCWAPCQSRDLQHWTSHSKTSCTRAAHRASAQLPQYAPCFHTRCSMGAWHGHPLPCRSTPPAMQHTFPAGRASIRIHAAVGKGPRSTSRKQQQHSDGNTFELSWGAYEGDKLTALQPSQELMRAPHKHYLTPTQRDELSRRLRRESLGPFPWAGPAAGRALRLYRYGVDDLRLYRSIAEARMEGLIVVADRPEEADVVLATKRKRTGRDIVVSPAVRAAQKAGIPYLELQTFSGLRLMQALARVTGVPVPPHLLRTATPADPRVLPAHGSQAADAARRALDGIRIAEQLQIDGGPAQQDAAREGAINRGASGARGAGPDVGVAAPQQWSMRQEVGTDQTAIEVGHAASTQTACGAGWQGKAKVQSPVPPQPAQPAAQELAACDLLDPGHHRAAVLLGSMPAGAAAVLRARGVDGNLESTGEEVGAGDLARLDRLGAAQLLGVDGLDVEDSRAHLLPPNPREWAGARAPLLKPAIPGSKRRAKLLMKRLAEQHAPW